MNSEALINDLTKWQAASHPTLAERKPDELFQADFAEVYVRLHHDLWERIVRVHGTIYTLEQLDEFPFEHLYAPQNMEFWRLVVANFLDMTCILIHALVNDTGKDSHSIRSFKNEIVKGPWLDQRMRELLCQTLREREFDKGVDSVAERLDKIRDARVAHRLINKQTGYLRGRLAGVSLPELRRLFDATHALFGALSFGSGYVTLSGDLLPRTVAGKRTKTCLEEVLDSLLRDSYFVNEPERRQSWWSDLRKHIAPEQLQLMNELRRRIGLPEA